LNERLINETELLDGKSMTEITSTRRQQKEERREQILDAALRVFAEKGFAGASIRDIAKEVGVTEGLLYHYFESKEQLLNTCWKERTWRAHLERILTDGANQPLADVLGELIRDFLQTLRENAEMVRVCATEMQRNPEMKTFHASMSIGSGRTTTLSVTSCGHGRLPVKYAPMRT
jgi:AcrR family transcriptional regulator